MSSTLTMKRLEELVRFLACVKCGRLSQGRIYTLGNCTHKYCEICLASAVGSPCVTCQAIASPVDARRDLFASSVLVEIPEVYQVSSLAKSDKREESEKIMDIFEYSDDEGHMNAAAVSDSLDANINKEETFKSKSETKALQSCHTVPPQSLQWTGEQRDLTNQYLTDQGWRPRSCALNSLLNSIAFHLAEVERALEHKRARKRERKVVSLKKSKLDEIVIISKPAPALAIPNPLENSFPKRKTLDTSPELICLGEVTSRSSVMTIQQQAVRNVQGWVDQGESRFLDYVAAEERKSKLLSSTTKHMINQPRRPNPPWSSKTKLIEKQRLAKKYVATSTVSSASIVKHQREQQYRKIRKASSTSTTASINLSKREASSGSETDFESVETNVTDDESGHARQQASNCSSTTNRKTGLPTFTQELPRDYEKLADGPKYPITSNTPLNFWNTQIPNTQEMRDNYILYSTPFTPPPRRRQRRSSDDDSDQIGNEEGENEKANEKALS